MGTDFVGLSPNKVFVGPKTQRCELGLHYIRRKVDTVQGP